MYDKFAANLDIQNSGAVVASPDKNTPGGSYYFNWMRDAALSLQIYQELNDLDYNKVQEVMYDYQSWVAMVQKKPDKNNDVRIEPKFNIPSGDPYTGGWCRPQTDGPGIRSNTLITWSHILINAGKTDEAKNTVWPIITQDLDWVVNNWQS